MKFFADYFVARFVESAARFPEHGFCNIMSGMPEDKSTAIAEILLAASRVVVFTGAGISTESGIPDFRSPGGVWTRYKPVMYQEFLSDHDARKRYWAMKKEFYMDMDKSKPNAAHEAVAALERLGKLHTLITQNIDGLHQDAGSSPEIVVELHGTNRWVDCLDCSKRYGAADIQKRLAAGEEVPQCGACGGWLKPATISFGQSMPVRETARAQQAAGDCDAFIVVGSSLVVQPAASMPLVAKHSGAQLVIINLDETPMDGMADIVWREKAGTALPPVVDELKNMMRQRN